MMLTLGRRALLLVYTLIIVVPLAVVLFGSVKTQQEMFEHPFAPTLTPQLDGYATVLGSGGLGQALFNSTVITVSSVLATLVIASLAAYALARVRGWLGTAVYALLILGMAVPAQANMIPQRVLFEVLGLLDSRFGLVLINVVVTLPVAVFILTGFMRSLPGELFEAAAIDGAGDLRVFRSVVLPLSLPSLAATAIFLFVMHWNDLLYPLLFIQSPEKKTLPLALLGFQGEFLTNYPLLFSGVVVASLPLVVAYVFLQRYFIEGMTAGTGK
ncbi:carbohydrate ABC transporter permease [Naumannella sp. ID2617S]|nr:carbohydrate ABC transporter permease [Naumannella sp. ID2617S]